MKNNRPKTILAHPALAFQYQAEKNSRLTGHVELQLYLEIAEQSNLF